MRLSLDELGCRAQTCDARWQANGRQHTTTPRGLKLNWSLGASHYRSGGDTMHFQRTAYRASKRAMNMVAAIAPRKKRKTHAPCEDAYAEQVVIMIIRMIL